MLRAFSAAVGSGPPLEPGAEYRHAAVELEAFARRQPAPRPPARVSESEDTSGLSFCDALRAVRGGAHAARAQWSGGRYVTAQAAYPQGIGINANAAAATGLPPGSLAAFHPYLMMQMAAGGARPPVFVPWAPGQEDLFADDWELVPRPDEV